MAKDTNKGESTPQTLMTKTLYKANGRGEDATKERFDVNCWPVGDNEVFIANAIKGLGMGFVVRAISQVLSIDARAAFVKNENMAMWQPNADGTASSGDGYATIRRDLRKKGVAEEVIEAIIENAKGNVA